MALELSRRDANLPVAGAPLDARPASA